VIKGVCLVLEHFTQIVYYNSHRIFPGYRVKSENMSYEQRDITFKKIMCDSCEMQLFFEMLIEMTPLPSENPLTLNSLPLRGNIEKLPAPRKGAVEKG
jgi:hypothetical protein